MLNIPTMHAYLSEIALCCASDYEQTPSTFGLAHILEHLKCKPKAYDRWDLFGGAFQNASTNRACTDFYALLPGEALVDSINVYTDQQRSNDIQSDQLHEEIPAVMNEYERSRVNPMRRILGSMHALADVGSPERFHATIGFRESIANATVEDLNAFANDYYTMDRACLVLVGNFSDAAFRDRIVEHVHSTWGMLPKTTCKQRRVSYDSAPLQPGCREECMFVSQPGFRFLGTCVEIPRANQSVSIVHELVAMAMNGHDGALQALVDTGLVQCVEANAERTMAKKPLFQIMMNCHRDDAREALLGVLCRVPSEAAFQTSVKHLRAEYEDSLSDISKVAETFPNLMSYSEGNGALAAHDIVTRCSVLDSVTYEHFSEAWTALTSAFATRSYTVHALSAHVDLPPEPSSHLMDWSKPHVDVANRLCPSVVDWDLSTLKRQMHPIHIDDAQTNKVHICARLGTKSIGYHVYLKELIQRQVPPDVRCTVSHGGDCIQCSCVMDWEHVNSASRWLVKLLKAPVNHTIAPQIQFSVRDTYSANPQCAVDFKATSLVCVEPRSLDATPETLVAARDHMLQQPFEISMYLPRYSRSTPNPAVLSQVMHTFQSCRLRYPSARPLFTGAFSPTSTCELPLDSSIAVCTVVIPCADIRDRDLTVLSALNAALGGDFNSMLMREVRLNKGLTYSTHSSLETATVDCPMRISVTGSFAPDKFAAGRDALHEVIDSWKQISESDFDFGKRVTLMRNKSLRDVPGFSVGHAQFLRQVGMTNDGWAEHANAITYEDAQRVLATHVNFDNIVTAVSTPSASTT